LIWTPWPRSSVICGAIWRNWRSTLRQMVSFRSRVVHLYWDVDDAIVYRILRENLDDFETYVGYILDFTQAESAEEE